MPGAPEELRAWPGYRKGEAGASPFAVAEEGGLGLLLATAKQFEQTRGLRGLSSESPSQ